MQPQRGNLVLCVTSNRTSGAHWPRQGWEIWWSFITTRRLPTNWTWSLLVMSISQRMKQEAAHLLPFTDIHIINNDCKFDAQPVFLGFVEIPLRYACVGTIWRPAKCHAVAFVRETDTHSGWVSHSHAQDFISHIVALVSSINSITTPSSALKRVCFIDDSRIHMRRVAFIDDVERDSTSHAKTQYAIC